MAARAFALLASGASVCTAAGPGQLSFPTMNIGKDVHGAAVLMPMAGAGTWLYNDTVAEAEVAIALRLGARLIDTANTYGNQVEVAQAVTKSGVPRNELFISTKVPGGLSTEATIAAADQNLQQLGVESVDLLLTHFPCAMTNPPSNCNKAARQATWKGLETVYKAGKARAIGVSHYCQKHMEDVLEIATVPIAVNQEEWHVGMGPDPKGLVSFCKAHGISYQSFSPFVWALREGHGEGTDQWRLGDVDWQGTQRQRRAGVSEVACPAGQPDGPEKQRRGAAARES